MLKSKTSTILAATALVVAVFGSTPLGHAAVSIVLPKGSVGTYQLKRGAVTSLKVKNYSLVAADFKAGQLPTGPQGPKGDTGAPGVSGYQIVYENIVSARRADRNRNGYLPCREEGDGWRSRLRREVGDRRVNPDRRRTGVESEGGEPQR